MSYPTALHVAANTLGQNPKCSVCGRKLVNTLKNKDWPTYRDFGQYRDTQDRAPVEITSASRHDSAYDERLSLPLLAVRNPTLNNLSVEPALIEEKSTEPWRNQLFSGYR